jgi:hypothetical protein
MQPHIFIASSIEYEPLYVDKLLDNIRAQGNIPLDRVHVIVGGCENETCTTLQDGITIDRVVYRCFEFTPMIFVGKNPEKYDFEYAFFTHDTVRFESRFYPYICFLTNKMKVKGAYTAPIEAPEPSMNMGIYHRDSILECMDELEGLCMYTNDHSKLWDMKNKLMGFEDFIINRGPMYKNATETPEITEIKDGTKKAFRKTFARWGITKVQQNRMFISSISPFDNGDIR